MLNVCKGLGSGKSRGSLLYQMQESKKKKEHSSLHERGVIFLESTYSMPIERRDTLTTRRSKMLNEFRQKDPL